MIDPLRVRVSFDKETDKKTYRHTNEQAHLQTNRQTNRPGDSGEQTEQDTLFMRAPAFDLTGSRLGFSNSRNWIKAS